jgi:hypothetical protein
MVQQGQSVRGAGLGLHPPEQTRLITPHPYILLKTHNTQYCRVGSDWVGCCVPLPPESPVGSQLVR